MVSSIATSSSALPLLLLLSPIHYNAYNRNIASADTCEGDDPLWCPKGQCRNGQKDYANLLGVTDFGTITKDIRGMYCECPDDTTTSSYGMSGIHCQNKFEKCNDDTICFNGGFCEHNSENYSKYHCGCPQDDKADGGVYAGRACETKAQERDFCTRDSYFDVVGSRWFCVNGGRCIDGEDDLAKKCDCAEGFVGLHCEYDKAEFSECSLKCENGGACNKGAKDISKFLDYGIDVDHFLGGSNINGEHCICPEGFSGVRCEIKNVKHCGAGVCFNGGLCVETIDLDGTVKDYHCECNELGDKVLNSNNKVAGEFCEHPEVRFCPAPEGHKSEEYYCANGGACPLGEPHEPCTDCDEGWEGSRCEKKIRTKTIDNNGNEYTPRDNSDCDLKCQNGGKCFFGDHPMDNTEQFDLVPGLEFLQDNKHCRCPDGYIGLKCEMRYERCGAGEHYCLHGSGCVPDNDEFTCDCNEVSTELVAYAGHYCEHTATEFCQGPGAGKHSFCTDHGTCRGQVGLGSDHVGCDCQEGWAGEYCEYKIEQLRTNGVATKAFVGFLCVLLLNTIVFSVYACARKHRMERNKYESAAVHEMIANPYGDRHDDDSSDESDEEYELKEVTII